MRAAARFAISVNEKHEISMVRAKFSRLVSVAALSRSCRERDGVDEEVEPVRSRQAAKTCPRSEVLDVAGQDSDRRARERRDALAEASP
jgi:hypothetical protein